MESVPLHEKAPLTLTSTRTAQQFIGCLDMIVGTKIPANHDAICRAISMGARMHDMHDRPYVQSALDHVESERRAHSGEIRAGENTVEHAE